ncbi:MAG: DegT/DnrJ/EryC1/StrS family aminotransferase [Acidobacteria bacterium]|nr:DegT/DnrJ/EryC1/StrS family aminotransferase [Acidobacteriota bacterium]
MKRRVFLAAVPALAAARPPVRATRLSTSYPGTQFYDQQEQNEVLGALESRSLFRWYGPGTPKKVARFEQELARFMGVKHALAVTSGTAALHCALTALGVGPGDEVILPAWAWYSCYNAILLTGALPVFGEVDESFALDAADVEKKITPRTKAIMVLHLAGCPADMDRLMAVARQHNVRVLEDSAQSVGGQYKGKRLGSIGDIGIYSFQISKTITAGEGGAVVTNDPLLFERAARFHDLGILRPGHQEALGKAGMPFFLGTNYRMNEMTGAVMGAQLRKLETILGAFRRNSRYVKERIRDLPGLRLRSSPDPDGEIGVTLYLLFPSREQRDRFVAGMRAENVPASPPSGSLVLPAAPYIEQKVAPHPEWPSFRSERGRAIRYGAGCCPRTEEIFSRAAGVHIGPKYSEGDLTDIVEAIRKVHG